MIPEFIGAEYDPGKIPKKGFLRDSVQILDERTKKYKEAFEARFKRQETQTFFKSLNLITTTVYTSESFFCEPFIRGLALIYMPDTIGAPTDILISLEFSDDNVNWYKFMEDFWGDLRWEDVGAPYSESLQFPVLAPYIRFKAISAGSSDQAYFTLNLKAVFNS